MADSICRDNGALSLMVAWLVDADVGSPFEEDDEDDEDDDEDDED